MTAELEQTTVSSENQEPAHYQGDPSGKPVIESMPPLQRKELFSLVGITVDKAIARALRERGRSVDGVGLFSEEENSEYSPEPYGHHYEDLDKDDLVLGGFERINEGFFDTLETYAFEILNAAKKRRGGREAQRAYNGMSMITAGTGISIEQLVIWDAISPFLSNMEVFTENMLDEFLMTSDRGFKEKAISRFAAFWEKHAEYAGPRPSEGSARKLWGWYVDLVSNSCFYNPLPFTATSTE